MQQHGFTIIELIIAIFILSVTIVGIFSALSVMIILTANAADRLTAAYLAQEGIEVVRNIRDTNWLNMDAGTGANWYDTISECTAGCELDYTTGTGLTGATPVTTWSDPGDYLNIKNGFYMYDATNSAPTKFKREVTVTFISDYAMKVSVTVFWNQKQNLLNPTGAPGSIQVEDTLYDWYNHTSS